MATRPSSSTDSESGAAPGTAEAPPRLGEGCLARYDVAAMDEAAGADFSAAAALWRRLQVEAAGAAPAEGAAEAGDAGSPQSS